MIEIIVIILMIVLALIVVLFGMTYLYHLFLGVFPVIGIVLLGIAIVVGMIVALRGMIRAMKKTYGRDQKKETKE